MNEITAYISYRGEAKEYLHYEDIFLLDADLIESVEIPDDQMTNPLASHPAIETGWELEFLCRLLERDGGVCSVNRLETLEPDEKQTVSQTPDRKDRIGFIYAYLIRYHMDRLKALNAMDRVFKAVCDLMMKKECFAEFQRYMNHFLSRENDYEQLAVMVAPFLILRGDDTCSGVLQQFADDLTAALRKQGQEVYVFGGDEQADQDSGTLWKKMFKGVIGFQTPALENAFFRGLKGTKYQFWFDNPFSFRGILRDLPKDHVILCQDADHAQWIREYFHSQAVQLPPGGTETEPVAVQERCMDVLFMGRYFAEDRESLNEAQRAFFSYMIDHPLLNFEQGMQEMLEKKIMTTEEVDLIKIMYQMKPACRAVIGHYRNKVVEAIVGNGIELHVFGNEWNRYDGAGKDKLIIHPEIPSNEAIHTYQKAKIGLNVMSWYKAGMTERVANIMLSGAVCVSDETAYLKEHTKDGSEIVLYRLDRLYELSGRINGLLQNEEERCRIAEAGYQKAKAEFSWDARAKELINLTNSFA